MSMEDTNYREVTARYYSKWLGRDGILSGDFKGITYLYSEERNHRQYGYETALDLYVFCQKDRIIVSYGDKAGEWTGVWKDKIRKGMSAAEVKQVLERTSGRRAGHSMVFNLQPAAVFPRINPEESLPGSGRVRILSGGDYGEYESFWRKCHPGSRDTDWLKEYFDEMTQEHMCIGTFIGDVLVSCTDAPGMPYMENEVQEIGINTLTEYRGRGYASAACKRCIKEILSRGRVPLWSAGIDNPASRRLAEKVGFTGFGEVVSLTLTSTT